MHKQFESFRKKRTEKINDEITTHLKEFNPEQDSQYNLHDMYNWTKCWIADELNSDEEKKMLIIIYQGNFINYLTILINDLKQLLFILGQSHISKKEIKNHVKEKIIKRKASITKEWKESYQQIINKTLYLNLVP